ncbi:LL-diaminopimelate aminotransferase [Bienertia sinuspersici]
MDHKKSQVSSSSSLTSQLFGPQESSSSNDVLASIFPPKGKGPWQNEHSGYQPWNNKQDSSYIHRDATYGSSISNERHSIYHQEGAEPCHLSSSLYYGGQDVCSKSHTSHSSTSYPIYKKDGGGSDPSGGASRGNWWQGSLYY